MLGGGVGEGCVSVSWCGVAVLDGVVVLVLVFVKVVLLVVSVGCWYYKCWRSWC